MLMKVCKPHLSPPKRAKMRESLPLDLGCFKERKLQIYSPCVCPDLSSALVTSLHIGNSRSFCFYAEPFENSDQIHYPFYVLLDDSSPV